jgi:TATA-box binding protein (TBP) (component of TFIID and TFIIIB)
MSELCEFTKTQANEAHQCKQMILNGIEAMGNNITKAINSEIQAMSTCMDVLNQASLDAIMNKLNTSSYAKETSKPHTAK